MTDLILISHVRVGDPYEADVRALLNEAYPEGAPDELGLYYGKHGPPDATVLLRLAQRIVGHLSIYERRIKVGSDEVMAGLVGEVAVGVDQRGRGHVRADGQGASAPARAIDPLLDPVRVRASCLHVQRLSLDDERDAVSRQGPHLENPGLPRRHGRRTARTTLAGWARRSLRRDGVARGADVATAFGRSPDERSDIRVHRSMSCDPGYRCAHRGCETLVIASEATQSRAECSTLDCFVASLLAMTIVGGERRRLTPPPCQRRRPPPWRRAPGSRRARRAGARRGYASPETARAAYSPR